MQKTPIFVVSVLFVFSLLYIPVAESWWGPRIIMSETVTAHYSADSSNATSGIPAGYDARGQAEIIPPNSWDILQFIRINFSQNALTHTYILPFENYPRTYGNYAVRGPGNDSGTTLYFNTTLRSDSPYYPVTYDWAPPLNLTMSVTNAAGGKNLYSANNLANPTNIVRFNITIRNDASPGSKDYDTNPVTLEIRFNKDSFILSSASVNVSTLSCTSGNVIANNSGGAADNDTIIWTGTLSASTQASIIFNANITSQENYNGHQDNLNGETPYIGARATYIEDTSLFSGITVEDTLARGPVREGLEMYRDFFWELKVYIKNMANVSLTEGEHNLTYNISGWRIYNITESTGEIAGLIDSNDSVGVILNPGEIYITPDWTRSYRQKPYIAPYFDWEVLFNETNTVTYSSVLNISMQMPTLYEIDAISDKMTSRQLIPYIIEENITTLNQTVIHSGSGTGNADVGKIRFYTTIPFSDAINGSYANMTVEPSSIRLFFRNTTGLYELSPSSPGISSVITLPNISKNGTFIFDISDLSSVRYFGTSQPLGHNLTSLDSLTLSCNIMSHAIGPDWNVSGLDNYEEYIFGGNISLWTESGTPLIISSRVSKMATDNILDAYKELTVSDIFQPELVRVTIGLTITGTVENILFQDYLPWGFTNSTPVSISFDGITWQEGIDYVRNYLGTTITSDGTNVTVWEYTNVSPSSTGWNITDNSLMLTYLLNISQSGNYILPLQIAAFDPGANRSLTLTRYGIVQIVSSESFDPVITRDDGDLKLSGSISVGSLPVYRKSFVVYNPNDRPVKSSFRTGIYPDAHHADISYFTIYGQKINEIPVLYSDTLGTYAGWDAYLNPRESRTYEIRVYTPPVSELGRSTEVIEKRENKNVLLNTEIILKNNARENYPSVNLPVSIASDHIISVHDSDDVSIPYSSDTYGRTIISIDDFLKNSIEVITIEYLESYPSISISSDESKYESGSRADFDIRVMNGAEPIADSTFEVEVYTGSGDMIFADLFNMGDFDSLEEKKTTLSWIIPDGAPTGKYVVNLYFSEDMSKITSCSSDFYVLGSLGSSSIFAYLLVVGIIVFVLISILRKKDCV